MSEQDKTNPTQEELKATEQSNAQDKSPEGDNKSTSNHSDENTRLKGTISALQKQINELREQQNKEVEALKQQIAEKDARELRDASIDALDVDEPIKRELKRRVSVGGDLDTAIQEELEALSNLMSVATQKKPSVPVRPVNEGGVVLPSLSEITDANIYLKNKDAYRSTLNG